jgi:magnesium transporter
MLLIHRISERLEPVREIAPDTPDRFWIDLADPTPEDRERVERTHGLHLPAIADLKEIEATSRFFVDDDGMHLRASFLDAANRHLEVHSVGFIVSDRFLISLRTAKLAAFESLREQPLLGVGATSPLAVFLRLVEIQLDSVADRIEGIYATIEAHRPGSEQASQDELDAEIEVISRLEADNDKTRFTLMDFELVLAALVREGEIPSDLERRFAGLRRDVDSLLSHSRFISEKLDFLMDLVMTRLSLVDNRVGKILSVVALVFLPPTLIGSIYGMNFHYMPELNQPWAYPATLAAMAASAVIPYVLFKWKRWL